jgi:UDPglucose 6-dehydrogenase
VGIFGCGHVGLVTGVCLAHLGHRVVCVDKDGGKIAGLRAGRLPIYEPGLQELVEGGLRRERLRFSSELSGAVDEAEVLFIAVDTSQNGDASADLSNVAAVARDIGQALAEANRERPLVVVNKSTVPVGSGNYVSMPICDGIEEAGDKGATEKRITKRTTASTSSEGVGFLVVSNPEFLRGGARSTTRFTRTGSW